uniref:(northern house mosquito) hypothetical protein n=1 Tax=Culex pipiens TaxID=7175 RepID=A0A8D8BPK2_CULPI
MEESLKSVDTITIPLSPFLRGKRRLFPMFVVTDGGEPLVFITKTGRLTRSVEVGSGSSSVQKSKLSQDRLQCCRNSITEATRFIGSQSEIYFSLQRETQVIAG